MGGPPDLVALDVRDGSERWRAQLAASWWGIPPGPFLGVGAIVAPLDDAGLAIAGLDPGSGAVLWRIEVNERTRAVAVIDGVVVVRDDSIVDPGPHPMTTDGNGALVAPTFSYELRGYDRATGAPMWSTEVERSPADDDPMFSAAVADDTVVFTPGPRSLDASTGQLGWHAGDETPALPIGTIANGVVLIGTLDQPTTALDLATGEELWTQPGSAPYAGAFAADDDAAYLTDRADLIAYDLSTGAAQWRRPNVPEDYTWPWHVTGDTLFTMWWNLEARSTTDGSIKWQTNYPIGDQPTGPTPRMISIATNTTSAIVTFYVGTLGGD